MPKLRVMFFGLVCHVGNDPGKEQADHAAIVNARGHVPHLIWRDGTGQAHKEPLKLGGSDVFIGSVRSKTVPFSPIFTKYVVKLKDLIPTQKTVRTAVRKRGDKKKVHAYVVYPMEADGLLTVVDLYPKVGRHVTDTGVPLRVGCVARVTMMTVETFGTSTPIGYVKNDKWVEIASVPSDGCILFSNAELPGTPAAASKKHDHVRLYSELTDDPVEVSALDTVECTDKDDVAFPEQCNWIRGYVGEQRITASEYVECGNSSDP